MKTDRATRTVHGFFGALLGASLGASWAITGADLVPSVLAIGAGALLCGDLSARCLDRFWESGWWRY